MTVSTSTLRLGRSASAERPAQRKLASACTHLFSTITAANAAPLRLLETFPPGTIGPPSPQPSHGGGLGISGSLTSAP